MVSALQKEIDKQKDATAWSTARIAMAIRNKNTTKAELARNHWIDKRLHYDETKAIKEYEKYAEEELQRLHDKEYANLVAAEEFSERCKITTEEIFLKVLVPASIDTNQPLSWDYRFTGDTGLKSPTIREMLKELFDVESEPLSINNPQAFAAIISQKHDGQNFEFTFESEKRRTHFDKTKRAVTAHFVLRASRFPVREL